MQESTIYILNFNAGSDQEVVTAIERSGCRAVRAADGHELIGQAIFEQPSLILVHTPQLDDACLDACRHLRSEDTTRSVPIVIVTRQPAEDHDDLQFYLTAGAYVHPEAELGLLAAHLRDALDRGTEAHESSRVIVTDDLLIDRWRHRVTLRGREVTLTFTEFRLLWTLASQPGRVFSREELTSVLSRPHASVQQRTVDAHVMALRRKLGDHAGLIETVRSVGYRFREPKPAAAVGS